jgi:hypothetical protein
MQNFMKKLAIAVVASGMSTSMAFAAMANVKVTVACPEIKPAGQQDLVRNYGTYLAGTGWLRVNSGPRSQPLFQGAVLPGSNIPTNLMAALYKNNGVTYNPLSGAVICKYKSLIPAFDQFAISYIMTNALNGTVSSSTMDQIRLKFPMGLKA